MEARQGQRVRVRATVMFIDVVGFTPISEQLGAELAYGHVTAVMRLLDGILRRRGGFVDKYLGDAIMASSAIRGRDPTRPAAIRCRTRDPPARRGIRSRAALETRWRLHRHQHRLDHRRRRRGTVIREFTCSAMR